MLTAVQQSKLINAFFDVRGIRFSFIRNEDGQYTTCLDVAHLIADGIIPHLPTARQVATFTRLHDRFVELADCQDKSIVHDRYGDLKELLRRAIRRAAKYDAKKGVTLIRDTDPNYYSAARLREAAKRRK